MANTIQRFKRRIFSLLIAWALLSMMTLPGVSNAGPLEFDWLMKINQAAAEVSFSGTFVYIHDEKLESMHVARRIEHSAMQERLYALSGEPREVIRDQDMVRCYIPDQSVVVHHYRQVTGSGFPRILPDDLGQLKQNYKFSLGGAERIADRTAQQIRVIPTDQYRYGYNLWADQETGLLLRSDLVDRQGQLIEQYVFVNIEIGGEITDQQLAAVSFSDDLQLSGNNIPIAKHVDKSDWIFKNLPDGYKLSKHIKRMSPMDAGEVEHLVFTDGLSSVSVFIKAFNKRQSDMTGLSRMGSVHAYRTTLDNHRITAIGEVPANTVEFLAMGVSVSR